MDKRGDDEVRPVAGIPDDVLDKLQAVAGDDEKAIRAAEGGHKQSAYIVAEARGTRAELEQLLLKGVVPALMRLALEEKESAAKAWAGEMLGSIFGSLWKYDKKLCALNAAFKQQKEKILGEKQFVQVVVSPKPIMETVRRELKKAEDYRRRLLLLKRACGRTWKRSADEAMGDYLPLVELPELSKQSKARWWKELWPLIKKNNPDLLAKLRSRSDRAERVIPKDKTSGTKKINPRWKDYRNQFRNAFYTIVRLKSGGVL
jgi:hypothetical protein